MQKEYNSNVAAFATLGFFITLGLGLLGYNVTSKFIEMKKLDRFVTVKGLAEKQVQADLAIWPITIKGTGNSLQEINNKIEQDRNKVIAYLESHGFSKQEIEIGRYDLIDLSAREYRSNDDKGNRYIITATIDLISNKVDLVKKIYQQINDLVKQDIVLEIGDNYSFRGPRYEFTKLNEIKVEMLAEANKNAKMAASQFAADSDCRVGKIKRANQGVFSIDSIYGSSLGGGEGGANDQISRASTTKKVRVVTTIDYYLID